MKINQNFFLDRISIFEHSMGSTEIIHTFSSINKTIALRQVIFYSFFLFLDAEHLGKSVLYTYAIARMHKNLFPPFFPYFLNHYPVFTRAYIADSRLNNQSYTRVQKTQ